MSKKAAFTKTMGYKCIYIFEINDTAHRGLLKIGDATVHADETLDKLFPNSKALNAAAHKRIKSYTNTAGITYRLLHTELAISQRSVGDKKTEVIGFRDHNVHKVLDNSGIERVKVGDTTGAEWYRVDLETAKKAIAAVKDGYHNLSGTGAEKRVPIVFRPEQVEAIKMTCKQFKVANRMLWNAKMRFGKTLTALEVIRRMGFKKTIIMTHRPVVDKGWYEDFGKIFTKDDGYRYGSRGTGETLKSLLKRGDPLIYFVSIQDLRGSGAVGGKFNKNDEVFKTVWDCVIVDEAHEGTQTELGVETVNAVVKEKKGKTKYLALSGTPFNILKDYKAGEVYTWDYVMEQKAKNEWWEKHFGDSNPYEDLPELSIYTYDLGEVFQNARYSGDGDVAFNFREFFRTWTGDFKRDLADMPSWAKIGGFVHEKDMESFLNLLTEESETSAYPFSTPEYRDMFRHTLWMVPGVKEARALSALLRKHPVFGSGAFDIVNVAGDGDEEERGEEALKKVLGAIKRAERLGNYTITLSCGKLTTGVTVKEWSAVLMLSGSYSTSAANYLQTIFRVQSPGQIDGKAKERAYVFDFAPDRTLKMVAEAVKASAKPGKTSGGDRQRLAAFLNFCPVIGIAGSKMTQYDTGLLLQQMKRAYADRVVRSGFEDSNLYSDELYRLTDGDLSAFKSLKSIVGASKPTKRLDEVSVNEQGLTEEEYEQVEKAKKKPVRERTEEEKELLRKQAEAKKNRDNAISILRQISIRMPLLIFGADMPYSRDITLDEFVNMVDDASWEEFMPKGVSKEEFSKFRRFYDEDVFIAAGRRIRDIAHQADELEPTERAMKIAALFANFKNPDKETVLTPWRVVNLQLGNCVGGWDFYDEHHAEPLDEPRYVERGETTKNLFASPDTRILEINSKTGLYPLYVAYSTYRFRLAALGDEVSDEEKRKVWRKTVAENVFVICKTPMAKSITKRTLIGYSGGKINAHYFDDLIGMLRNKPQQFADKVRRPRYWGVGGQKMKFAGVVGNPPYQLQGGSGGDNDAPIYQHFVRAARSVEPDYISLIIPSRWFSGGRASLLGDFRKEMLNDPSLSVLYDYPQADEVFSDVEIKGGLCYFLIDRNHEGLCETHLVEGGVDTVAKRDLSAYDIYVRYPIATDILEKVKTEGDHLDALISADTPFGIPTNPKTSKKTPFDVFDESTPEHDVVLYYLEKGTRLTGYVRRKDLKKNYQDVDRPKAIYPLAGWSGNDPNILGKPMIAPAHSVCSQTYLYTAFDTADEVENFVKYYKTRFLRFLVSIAKITQHAMKRVYRYVPLQDFTAASDIDWSQSSEKLDEQLFDKYGLTLEEREFILGRINPM